MNRLNKRDFFKATALLGTAAVVPAASLAADEGAAALAPEQAKYLQFLSTEPEKNSKTPGVFAVNGVL